MTDNSTTEKRNLTIFSAFMDHLPGLAWIKAPGGQFLYVNRRAGLFFGRSPEACLGLTHRDLLPAGLAKALERHEAKVINTGSVQCAEYEFPTAAGDVPQEMYSFEIPVEDGESPVGAISFDISRRREAERLIARYQRQLRSLVAQLSQNEQREQRRIAQSLHDDLGHSLTLGKMHVSEAMLEDLPPDVRDLLGEAKNELDRAIQYTRSLTAELASPVLYELGLESALQTLAEETAERYDVAVTVEVEMKEGALDEDASVMLYQCLRELLFNVVKHAGASNTELRIRQDGERLLIRLSDDGEGFADRPEGPVDIGAVGGFGLFSVRERIEHYNGRFSINSTPGGGCTAQLTVPLAGDAAGTDHRDKNTGG